MSKKKKQAKGVSGEERQSSSRPEPPLHYPSRDLALRFIDVLERQLQAKDEQLRLMDARLQDAYDMQRALALIIRQYEQRTGLSSDVLWDQIPEEELQRQQQSSRSAAQEQDEPDEKAPEPGSAGRGAESEEGTEHWVTDAESEHLESELGSEHPVSASEHLESELGSEHPVSASEHLETEPDSGTETPGRPSATGPPTESRTVYTPQDPPRSFEDWLTQRP